MKKFKELISQDSLINGHGSHKNLEYPNTLLITYHVNER